MRTLTTLKRLLSVLWPRDFSMRLRIILGILCLLTAKFATVSLPFFYKMIVDHMSLAHHETLVLGTLLTLVAGYALVGVTKQIFEALTHVFFVRIEQGGNRRLSLSVFEHLHQLSLRFHLNRQTGALSRSIERGTKSIELFMRWASFSILPTSVELTLMVGFVSYFYPPIFAIMISLTMVLYIAFTFFVSEWRAKSIVKMNNIDSASNAKAIDSLINYATVKYFGNEEHEVKGFDKFLTSYANYMIKNRKGMAFLNCGQGLITTLSMASVMAVCVYTVTQGDLTPGDFVLIYAYFLQLYGPLHILGTAYRDIKQSLIDMQGMFDILDVQPEIKDAPDARAIALHQGEIVFENVSFAYDDRPILKNVSFRIPSGKTVAVVGTSGGGKTTLLNLLFRFFDPQEGRITLDGQDIRTITQQSLRQALGIVPQDAVLFNDTIGNNISYGLLGAAQTEIESVAKKAHIHDFIMKLKDRYDTVVGERGLKLSGGEKQRVAIARMLIKNPPVYIFDEATSSLDTQTERAIQNDIEKISKHHTTLMIAHRLSTVVHADHILVFQNGKIIEEGDHPTLVKQKGLYAQLWETQRRETAEIKDA